LASASSRSMGFPPVPDAAGNPALDELKHMGQSWAKRGNRMWRAFFVKY
jgi:hypothetical protein